MEPIKDTQVFQFIEHLTLEDLQDIVKYIYCMPIETVPQSLHAGIQAKINILEYVGQDYVQIAYWNSVLGEVPPPDTESSNE